MSSLAIHRFSGELERTAGDLGAGGLLSLPGFALKLARHRRESRKAIEIIRSAMEMCGEYCKDAPCAAQMYQDVKTIRDNYLKIHTITSKLPMVSVLNRLIEGCLDDWDDLAEDCAIASDEQIRSTIVQIAEKL